MLMGYVDSEHFHHNIHYDMPQEWPRMTYMPREVHEKLRTRDGTGWEWNPPFCNFVLTLDKLTSEEHLIVVDQLCQPGHPIIACCTDAVQPMRDSFAHVITLDATAASESVLAAKHCVKYTIADLRAWHDAAPDTIPRQHQILLTEARVRSIKGAKALLHKLGVEFGKVKVNDDTLGRWFNQLPHEGQGREQKIWTQEVLILWYYYAGGKEKLQHHLM